MKSYALEAVVSGLDGSPELLPVSVCRAGVDECDGFFELKMLVGCEEMLSRFCFFGREIDRKV